MSFLEFCYFFRLIFILIFWCVIFGLTTWFLFFFVSYTYEQNPTMGHGLVGLIAFFLIFTLGQYGKK